MIKATTKGLPAILDDFRAIARTFDLDRHDLADRMMDIATFEILAHMDAEVDPDGVAWAPLSQKYIEYKAEIAPQAPMAVLFGVMKTWDQVAGERHVETARATMTYGTDDAARIEAVKFTEGGAVTGTDQPQRPFFGLTNGAVGRIDAMLERHFQGMW